MLDLSKWWPDEGFTRHDEALQKRIWNLLWLFAFFAAMLAIDFMAKLLGKTADLRYLTPYSLWSLETEHLYAIAFTITATIAAFIASVATSYCIGIIAAVLATTSSRITRIGGGMLQRAFDFFYIIPIVVSLSLVLAVLLTAHLKLGWSSTVVVLGSLISAATILGGYQVFEAIYRSAVRPSDRDLLLVESLHPALSTTQGFLSKICTAINKVLRLRDCNIEYFSNAIIRAFHLSVVAVIIVESIRPSLYEYMFPQTGIVSQRYGGIGQVILTSQNNTQFEVIIGLIWAVFIFDAVAVLVIEQALGTRYGRHYGERQ